jgi:hypothetical protein
MRYLRTDGGPERRRWTAPHSRNGALTSFLIRRHAYATSDQSCPCGRSNAFGWKDCTSCVQYPILKNRPQSCTNMQGWHWSMRLMFKRGLHGKTADRDWWPNVATTAGYSARERVVDWLDLWRLVPPYRALLGLRGFDRAHRKNVRTLLSAPPTPLGAEY